MGWWRESLETDALPPPADRTGDMYPSIQRTAFALLYQLMSLEQTMSFEKCSVGSLLIGKGFMFAVVPLTFDLRWTALTAALHTCLHPLTRAGEGNAY